MVRKGVARVYTCGDCRRTSIQPLYPETARVFPWSEGPKTVGVQNSTRAPLSPRTISVAKNLWLFCINDDDRLGQRGRWGPACSRLALLPEDCSYRALPK